MLVAENFIRVKKAKKHILLHIATTIHGLLFQVGFEPILHFERRVSCVQLQQIVISFPSIDVCYSWILFHSFVSNVANWMLSLYVCLLHIQEKAR